MSPIRRSLRVGAISPRTSPGLATLLVFSLVAVISALPGPVPAASAYTYVLEPVVDTTVSEADPNNTNLGGLNYLAYRYTGSGNGLFSFVRYQRPTLAGSVTSATLRVRFTGTAGTQQIGFYSASMGNPTWAENSLSWNNWATGSTFTYLGGLTNQAPQTYANFNVTNYVGSSNLTFGLTSSVDAAGQQVASREGSVPVTLTIVTSGTPPDCTPEDLRVELLSLIQTGRRAYICNYEKDLDPGFTAWGGGSENKPVVAAAIALWDGPTVGSTDYRQWWQSFFNHQATPPGASSPAAVDYFKSTELFSNVYDTGTTSGAMAVHLWAHLQGSGQATLKALADAYLTRTFYAWSLGASNIPFSAVYDVNGSMRTLVNTSNIGTCPTIAVASSRSIREHSADRRRFLLARALGYSSNCYAQIDIKNLVNEMFARWSGVSGLDPGQVTALKALINCKSSGCTNPPSDVATVLGAVRMKTKFHWLMWADGRRASFYEGSQLNNNVSGGKQTVYAAHFDPTPKELELLFAFGQGNQSCVVPSSNQIFVEDTVSGCGSNHVYNMDPSPTRHYVLGSSGWKTCSTLDC